jgi:hypothetical protein
MRTKQDDDDAGHLRDGQTLRVPMLMRDSADAWRNDMAADMARDWAKIKLHDGQGQPVPRRPCFVYSTDEAALDEKERAYIVAEEHDRDAWKGSSSIRHDVESGKVGDACTIDGAPGHLQMVSGKLTCISDKSQDSAHAPTGDAAYDSAVAAAHALVDEKERAYRLRELEDCNAWRRF